MTEAVSAVEKILTSIRGRRIGHSGAALRSLYPPERERRVELGQNTPSVISFNAFNDIVRVDPVTPLSFQERSPSALQQSANRSSYRGVLNTTGPVSDLRQTTAFRS